MRMKIFLFLASIILLLSTSSAGLAQSLAYTLWPGQPDLTGFPIISVPFSAWDENGLPPASLTTEQITLQENGGATFHPSQVSTRTDAGLQVILVIDVSQSMRGQPLADAKIAAARFLDHLTKGDSAGLIAFANGVNPDPFNLAAGRELALSNDLIPLYDQVEKVSPGGSTELYRAAAKAVGMLQGAPAGHRAVLLLSDGRNDPPEVGDPQEPIRLAQAAKIPFFVIGLGSQVDEPYLRRLAGETGGLYRAAPSSSELAQMFGEMATLLKTRYILSFQSNLSADGSSAVLNLEISAQGSTGKTKIELGNLPLVPTATSTPSATIVPSPTLTPVPPTATETAAPPTPTRVPAESPPTGLSRWLAGGAAVLVVLIAFIILRRKPRLATETCARCGYDLTGHSGPCPQCGETRRLERRK